MKKNKMKDETITITKVNLWQGVSAVLGLLLIFSLYSGGFSGLTVGKAVGDTNNVKAAAPTGNAAAPAPTVNMEELIGDDHFKGDKDAPVTIIEWSDFECPFCGRFYSQTLGQIDEQYIKTGKVKLVYKDFPLSFHPQAQKSAEAAECAGEQDKFFEMHDLLFEKGVAGGVSSFKQFAGEIGLNQADFDKCLDSGAMAAEVQEDMKEGAAAGVRGTPGFLINGKLVSGAQPFSVFQQAIEAELAN